MRYTAMLCLLLCGCVARHLNPGATTAYWEVSMSALESHVPNKVDTVGLAFREHWCMGWCDGDGRRIQVYEKAPPWVGEHEVAHLIDCCHGDALEARRRLGDGVPDNVVDYLRECVAEPRWPGYQWAVLRRRWPGEVCVVHADKVALVRAHQ